MGGLGAADLKEWKWGKESIDVGAEEEFSE